LIGRPSVFASGHKAPGAIWSLGKTGGQRRAEIGVIEKHRRALQQKRAALRGGLHSSIFMLERG
jgi:hypothetical protein